MVILPEVLVHNIRNIIHNSQKLEATQMSFKQRMDTEIMVHLLFSYLK